ncbi:transposase family protein [Streptomyces sp. BK340]|uniref:transposase family protein n=1 Tax=Streptomyces sp. BK340 TaxID=2572903 RepID=UPI0011A541CB
MDLQNPASAGRWCPHGAGPGIDVRVEGVSDSSGVLVVGAVSTARPGRCPKCRKQARRVHSTYQRSLNERPLGSRSVIIRLRVRRYFCATTATSRGCRGPCPAGTGRSWPLPSTHRCARRRR